jgi:ssDNA-specific exonuclease RecJ
MIKIIKQLYANFLARREAARIRKKGKRFLAELKAKGPTLDRVGQVFVQKGTQKIEINTTLNQK